MKLLVVSAYFDTHAGGVEMVAGQIARVLAGRGVEVRWLACDASAAPLSAGVGAVPVRASNLLERRFGLPLPILTPGALATVAREVARADVVLIHDALYLTSIAAFLAARIRRRPVVLVQHLGRRLFDSALLQRVFDWGERAVTRPMLSSADGVVFISDEVQAHFAGVPLRREAEVSYAGIDELFRPVADGAERAALRAEFGLSHRPAVLYVGRFISSKGLLALRKLAGDRPDLDFALAGWGPLEPETWGLRNVRVFRTPDRAALARLYRCSDAFLSASPSESFSLVVREALASGLPVVCGAQTVGTDRQAAAWLTGVPLEGIDPAAAAARLSPALDRALASGTRPGAADWARERYHWPRIGRLYERLVRSLVRPAYDADSARTHAA